MARIGTYVGLIAAIGFAAPAAAKAAHCHIVTSGRPYDGPCRFQAEKGGSFALSHASEKPLVDDITMINVTIVAPGQAEVGGLTTAGISSRWGSARRGKDKACWKGEDFTVCAY